MNDQAKAYLYALLNAVIIGMSFFVVKTSLDSLTYFFSVAFLINAGTCWDRHCEVEL
ncbi:hypothetical protein [Shimazuella alba]|uniref:Uncharacterized protein n=1 Tax=Shimazuella alba TaxID=2690964 RepID=A0A6I4VWF5_9BACL|nr:hypothetical protein [Shimazuella alba]MXQ54210.1 hypothetical protein [Shimazuella alba]